MRKKYLLAFLVMSLAALLIVSACEAEVDDAEGENIHLQFATFWPSADFQVEEGHKAWAAEIKERVEAETPHTIEFSWHYSGALLGATEIYEGVADGSADLGSTCPSYTPGIFPATMAFELPGLENDNALVSSMAIQEAFETYEPVRSEYEDVKVMHFWATGPGDIISKTPVHSLEDFSGMDTRAAGGSVSVLNALGASPQTMPMSESYLSLNQGIVEGILAPTDTLKGFMLAEVTSYITKTPYLYNIVFLKVMNWDTWESLPEEVQVIFEEVNAEYVYEYGVLRTEHTKLGQEYAVEEYGHEVFELPTEEEERWLEAIEPVQENWIQDAEDAGLPGEEIMKKVQELDQKYSDEYGDYIDE